MEGQCPVERITWIKDDQLFTLVWGHASSVRELDSILLVIITNILASVHGALASLDKWGSPKQCCYRVTWRSEILSAFRQDILKWCPNLSSARERSTKWGDLPHLQHTQRSSDPGS